MGGSNQERGIAHVVVGGRESAQTQAMTKGRAYSDPVIARGIAVPPSFIDEGIRLLGVKVTCRPCSSAG